MPTPPTRDLVLLKAYTDFVQIAFNLALNGKTVEVVTQDIYMFGLCMKAAVGRQHLVDYLNCNITEVQLAAVEAIEDGLLERIRSAGGKLSTLSVCEDSVLMVNASNNPSHILLLAPWGLQDWSSHVVPEPT
jgi:hypothetical protein